MFNALYPLLHVRDVPAASRFYRDHFGFEPVFESDWYVQLRGGSKDQELALIVFDHETIPDGARHPTANLILSFEVADAAADAARFAEAGVPIVQPLRDEVFGQRHFIAVDPDGILLDVITPIEPDPHWVAVQH